MPPPAPAHRRPRIGISLDVGTPDEGKKLYELNVDYVDAVIRAGGFPVLLPHTHDAALRAEMIEEVDGLIIPGGSDADPALFGQARHARTKLVDKDRETFDLAMLSLAEQRGLPVLGICLGCQLMNVHRRGTLHQHLPDVERGAEAKLEHSRPGDRTNYHEISIRGGTQLSRMLAAGKNAEIKANSRHHQGIDHLGHGLVATASAPDGVIEAIEDPTLPFWVAVQWHPENLGGTDHDALFKGLIAAAEKRRAGKPLAG